MKFEMSGLTHSEQMKFLETVKENHIEDDYYKVFYSKLSKEFLLIKIDKVIKALGGS